MKKALCLSILLLTIVAGACSDKPPSVRVRNDYSKKVNVQLKPAVGNTITLNDVDAGSATGYQDVAETSWSASAAIQGESTAPATVFTTKNDMRYTVVISNTSPPEMHVESESK